MQWKNFASWLIVGGLVFGGFALLWRLSDCFARIGLDGGRPLYFVLLLATWLLGFINALGSRQGCVGEHAREAYPVRDRCCARDAATGRLLHPPRGGLE